MNVVMGYQGFSEVLSRWQNLWSRRRQKKLAPFGRVVLKSGPLRIHFQHSAVKLRGFEQNTDIIKFWLSYSMTANIFCCGRQEQHAKCLICYYACITCM